MLHANVSQTKEPLGKRSLKLGQTSSSRPDQSRSSLTPSSASRASSMTSLLGSTRKRKLPDDDSGGASVEKSKKPKTRSMPFFNQIPKGQQLKLLNISRKTFNMYVLAVEKFEQWARVNRRSLGSHKSVDEAMCLFLRHLCESGESMTHGTYAVFGWIKLRSRIHLDTRHQLPFSRDALKGWKSHFPGHSRTGVDLVLWDLIALGALDKGYTMCAAAIIIQGDAYLRPGELFDLTHKHLVHPSGSRLRNIWGVVIGLLELGRPTKAGEYDDVVIFNTAGRIDVNAVVRRLASRKLADGTCLFSPLTFDKYGKQLAESAQAVGLGHLHLTPHCLRHSGASHDAYHHIRDIHEIQTRGRWKAAKSVSRYKRPGRMLLSQSQVAQSVWRKAIQARAQVIDRLSKKLFWHGEHRHDIFHLFHVALPKLFSKYLRAMG